MQVCILIDKLLFDWKFFAFCFYSFFPHATCIILHVGGQMDTTKMAAENREKKLKIGDGCVIAAHALYITFTSDVTINGVHVIITGT